jgi:SAM-dependent methyltransferase
MKSLRRVRTEKLISGSLSTRSPVSRLYGLDRGQAIDRYYIESFLEREKAAVNGSCLELLTNDYTRRFGQKRVTRSEVLDIDRGNKRATIYGDLRDLKREIPDRAFDCIILTQTLQYIDECEAALMECRRILADNGVLLATVPTMCRLDVASGRDADFWRFTPAGARHLFHRVYGEENTQVVGYGNVVTGLGFWLGLAQKDLTPADFTNDDPDFPILVSVKAVKR